MMIVVAAADEEEHSSNCRKGMLDYDCRYYATKGTVMTLYRRSVDAQSAEANNFVVRTCSEQQVSNDDEHKSTRYC